jgi:hypothetical protein
MRTPSGRDLTLDLQTGKAPLILHTVQNIVNPFSSFTSEMEFLDINFTKDSSPFLHAIHSPSTGGFSSLDLKILKKIREKNFSLFMNM